MVRRMVEGALRTRKKNAFGSSDPVLNRAHAERSSVTSEFLKKP